ncbi:MAG TPA: hypothetical protein VKN99_16410 [Polyangia bacterium]|nr:hypothetical protein [Polyangia bacterium]
MRLGRWLAAALALSALGCAERLARTTKPPAEAGTLDQRSQYLKAHMKDGRLYILSQWSVSDATHSVSGYGDLFDPARTLVGSGPYTIALGDVALFETNVVSSSPTIVGLSILTVLTTGVTLACLTNPKACYGSCPTFYVWDGTRELLQAEGFSGSVAPALEETDLDALYRAQPSGRVLDVRMTNEALETHVVKHVHLLAAPRPAGGRVLATQSGALWQALALAPPHACTAAEGDCAAAVRTLDGRERTSTTDPSDLATREQIDLEFSAPAGQGALGVVVGARQTFLTTYLFYQALAYMGRSVGAWMATLERGDRSLLERVRGLDRALGGIEVLVADAGGRFQPAGAVSEVGPLAADVKVVPLPSPWTGVRAGQPIRVRLRLTRGYWRLDLLALARLGTRVEPVRLLPSVMGKQKTFPLVTLPGDEYRFRFQLPEHPERYELFLESRGYYLEWMREEWLREEDPARAALMFLNPQAALRLLAPEFKRHEARMEELFWRSRYARP